MDESTDRAITHQISSLTRNILILAIVTFISTLISGLEYGYYAKFSLEPLSILYEYLLEPLVYRVFLIVNFVERVPTIIIWMVILVNVVHLYRIIGHNSIQSYLIMIGCIIGLCVLSVLYFYLSVLFIMDVFFTSTLAYLDPDFLLLAFANIVELSLWFRLRSFIKITPNFSIQRKKRWIQGISILIFAVYASLLMKLIFFFVEIHWFSKWFYDYYLYYSFVFGISACVEFTKSVLYFIGGMIAAIKIPKSIPDTRFNFIKNR